MPSANVFVSDELEVVVTSNLPEIRRLVALELSTARKSLTSDQVSIRVTTVRAQMQLNPVEIEIFGHAFWHRLRRVDARAQRVALAVSKVVDAPVSCWLNLSVVGYSQSTK